VPGPFDPADPVAHPFTAFNFHVEVQVSGIEGSLAMAAFSEADGLEMSMEPKTIQLTLKRGMTANVDLWKWFERVSAPGGGGLRGSAEVVMMAADGATEQLRYRLGGCLPVKLKGSPLNAKDGQIAVEEMQIAYESLQLLLGGQPVTG
jgi:hypothetical protein